MLLKLGVSIEKLQPPARRALDVIEAIFVAAGEEPVITSTFEGSHRASSLHYVNLAFDVRLPKTVKIEDVRIRLGADYDVIKELTHWHIEYDPIARG